MKITLVAKKGSLFICLFLLLAVHKPLSAQENRMDSFDLLLQNISVEDHKQIKGDLLRSLHPASLLKALQMAEPSLRLSNNNEADGDNPHISNPDLSLGIASALPLGGRTISLQPLLIIDGYVTSINYLADFDINRVQSVVILDKASTLSLYGVKGGNGAIYIKTKDLASTGLSVSYKGTAGVSFADLSSYSLYSVSQKLGLEEKLGYYASNQPLLGQRMESSNPSDYWLKKGVRTGIMNKHSLEVEGGDNLVKFRISLLAAPSETGVMHGVKNNNYGVGANLEYKSQKLRISNDLRVDLANNTYVPNVTLLDFAMVNPYHAQKNSAGFINPILGEGTFNWQFSPSHENNINSFSKTNRRYISNNLIAKYNFYRHFSIQGSFTFHKNFDKRDQFISHLSKLYHDVSDEMIPYRGKYDIVRANQTTFEGKFMLGYNWSNEHHKINATAGVSSYNTSLYSDNYAAVGFPNISMSYISFANRYAFDSKPGGKESYDRVVGEFASASYSYDQRFFAGLNARIDQTSALHRDNRSFLSYSASMSWTVSNEEWFSNNFITKMEINASYGKTGYIDFGYSDVHTMYNYLIDEPYLDFSASSPIGLLSLNRISTGNPLLKPRILEGINVGANLSIANRVDLWFEYNHSLSADILSVDKVAPVKGFEEQLVNGGEILNETLRLGFNVGLVQAQETKVNLIVNMFKNQSKVKDVTDYHMQTYNSNIRAKAAQLYTNGVLPTIIEKGGSLDAIFADNGNGLEYIASTLPSLYGNISLTAAHKKLSAGLMFNYSLGSSIYNMTADYRIANGDPRYNLPKNAQGNANPQANRLHDASFVETNNVLRLSSANVSYQLGQKLSAGIIANNLFTHTSAKYERGWVYPYVKTIHLFIKATF